MSLVGNKAPIALAEAGKVGVSPSVAEGTGPSFKEVAEGLREKLSGTVDLNKELSELRGELLSKKKFAPAELLQYQILSSRFHLRVELVTKASESMLATFRRLQNPQ